MEIRAQIVQRKIKKKRNHQTESKMNEKHVSKARLHFTLLFKFHSSYLCVWACMCVCVFCCRRWLMFTNQLFVMRCYAAFNWFSFYPSYMLQNSTTVSVCMLAWCAFTYTIIGCSSFNHMCNMQQGGLSFRTLKNHCSPRWNWLEKYDFKVDSQIHATKTLWNFENPFSRCYICNL